MTEIHPQAEAFITTLAERLQRGAAFFIDHGFPEATEARQLVDDDIKALGEWLTVTQGNRERRSVRLVPAFTSRTNDYWHAGQASVLASGTATVFCNATSKGPSVGGSCFNGIDSVHRAKDHPGILRLLTPYYGWHHGILQPSGLGAMSEADQALVVVDLDPVHVVSGTTRPQLLPEPMSMVAYLPIVEVVRKEDNARALVAALGNQFKDEERRKAWQDAFVAEAFPATCEALHTWERRLPRQADSPEVESSWLGALGLNTAGGKLPRQSCGRYSLHSVSQSSAAV